jgi:hypothetical protein
LVWRFWRGGKRRKYFKIYMFGSIFKRGEEESKISSNTIFCFPQLEGFGGEEKCGINYFITLLEC